MRKLSNFHGFIGQARTVHFLRKQLRGAQALSHPCPHLLLVGPSGMGKTKLAHSLATEYGTECRVLLGKATPTQLSKALESLKKGDFLFLDEAHNLAREAQETLFEVIDKGRLTKPSDQHGAATNSDQKDKHELPPITVILATDQPGLLINALQKRMEHRIALNDYPVRELIQIASNAASRIGLVLSAQAARIVAQASQGQPRRAEHILLALRRHFAAQPSGVLGVDEVRAYLAEADMDQAGLDKLQVAWLRQLGRLGRASLETLANLLGIDSDFARTQVEPGLLKLGYVRIGGTGRCLTPAGKAWLKKWLKKRRPKRETH
jgi:Holliday junction resolvasome RuvABC ATP-dependent DNA helicase subunit